MTIEEIKLKHLGQSRIMKCGMEAHIIDYRKYNDIDVQFADGTIRNNIRADKFYNRSVGHPNIKAPNSYQTNKTANDKRNRENKWKMMNCGMKAEIINYNARKNVDVQFEDGTIIKNCTYGNFCNGAVLNPNLTRRRKFNKKGLEKIGKSQLMNCGMMATITGYRIYRDIEVTFDNGEVVEHVGYDKFQTGSVLPNSLKPNGLAQKRIKEKVKQHCGMDAEIINYQSATDINVRFDDGTVAEHVSYDVFKRGNVRNNNIPLRMTAYKQKKSKELWKQRKGIVKTMKCGIDAKIIDCQSKNNVTVQFLTGEIITSTYAYFNKGMLKPSPFMTTGESQINKILKDKTDLCNCTHLFNISLNNLLKDYFQFTNKDVDTFINKLKNDILIKNPDIMPSLIFKTKLKELRYDFSIITKNNKLYGFIEYDGEQHFKYMTYFVKSLKDFLLNCNSDRVKNILPNELGKILNYDILLLRIGHWSLNIDGEIEKMITHFLDPANHAYYAAGNINPYMSNDEYYKTLQEELNKKRLSVFGPDAKYDNASKMLISMI